MKEDRIGKLVTVEDAKELRKFTGCGLIDCKKALVAADNNWEKAISYLREHYGKAFVLHDTKKSPTDFEKWQSFLKEMKIPFYIDYIEREDYSGDVDKIIKYDMITIGYDSFEDMDKRKKELHNTFFIDEQSDFDIYFTKDGKFAGFNPWLP